MPPSPDGIQCVPTPYAAQPDLIEFESLDILSLEPLVQPPLTRSEHVGIGHGEYDISGPSRAREPIKHSVQPSNSEVTLLLDSPLDDGLAGSRILNPNLPDLNLETVVTAKGKEKERRYSNGRDYNNTGYSASTSAVNSRDTIPTLPSANPEPGVTVKGKEKERRHSDWGYYTGYPSSTSGAKQAAIVAQVATLDANIAKRKTLKAAKTQATIPDEAHYDSEPVSRLTYTKETKTNTNARASLFYYLHEPLLDLQRPILIN